MLDGSQLEVTDDLRIIKGVDTDALTVDADGLSRVLMVSGIGTELDLIGLTITGGTATGNGGGIYNSEGTLTLRDSTVSGNSSTGNGGGICNLGALVLTNSVVSMNSADQGGGIYTGSGVATLTSSMVLGNRADVDGGGIYGDGGTLTLINSTAVVNSAGNDGGGVYETSSTVTLTNATIAANTADQGGGIYSGAGALTLNNTMVALNDAATSANIAGTYASNSSLAGGDPAFFRNPSPGTDGLWGTVDDDYGDLRTLPGSPARDVGDNSLLPADEFDLDDDGDTVEPLPVDILGRQRIYGGIVDIGAYESPGPGDANGDGKVDGTDIALWAQNYDPLGSDAPHAWKEGDWNVDGKVDGTDLAIWQQYYDPLGTGNAGAESMEASSPMVGSAPAPMTEKTPMTAEPLPTQTSETELTYIAANLPALAPASVVVDDGAPSDDAPVATTHARAAANVTLSADDLVDVLMLTAVESPL